MKRILTYGYLLFLFSCTASQQESSELERLKAENEALKKGVNENIEKEKEAKNRKYRNNVLDYLKWDFNYNSAALGGINEVKVYFTNSFPYKLDYVRFSLKYIKANGELYKQEDLIFEKVKSNETVLGIGANSSRGTVCRIELQEVRANALNLCYSPTKYTPNDLDPFKCD